MFDQDWDRLGVFRSQVEMKVYITSCKNAYKKLDKLKTIFL